MESVQTDNGGAPTERGPGTHDTMGACCQYHAACDAADEARDAERERCALIAETMREDLGLGPVADDGYKLARTEIAEKIRSGK